MTSMTIELKSPLNALSNIPITALLLGAIAILVAVAVEFGLVYAGLFFLAVASIYRRPLVYFLGKLRNRSGNSDD